MTLPPERWESMLKHGPYETMEQLRNAVEGPGWREREAALKLAEENRDKAPRTVAEELGRNGSRSSRQVNVKLAEVDFDGLVALAVDRDLAPSSMARVLLRRAVHAALNEEPI